MLDRDLAELYEVETRGLVQAVKRNMDRFPADFMFQLSKEELENWKSQIVISNSVKMGLRKLPYAFTELGVAMLSSVLNSQKAIQVNIQIMRAFNYLKKKYLEGEGIRNEIESMDQKIARLARKQEQDVTFIFIELDRLDELIAARISRKQIGFIKED
ncbi:ORF6N domain-containing protein [candidate division KSB1 bacterium]|nr:ORF6N domain-containing protein [candidate division KSB1 bacterium]